MSKMRSLKTENHFLDNITSTLHGISLVFKVCYEPRLKCKLIFFEPPVIKVIEWFIRTFFPVCLFTAFSCKQGILT